MPESLNGTRERMLGNWGTRSALSFEDRATEIIVQSLYCHNSVIGPDSPLPCRLWSQSHGCEVSAVWVYNATQSEWAEPKPFEIHGSLSIGLSGPSMTK